MEYHSFINRQEWYIINLSNASSFFVYGDNPILPKKEDMLPNPLSPYAVAKLAGEKYCQVFSKLYDLETVILRYFNVFGPKQDPNSQYSAVIPKFIKLMTNDQSPTIYGDGIQSRDFTYVTNVVEGNLLAATKDVKSGLVMNCACHGQVTLNELVKQINLSREIRSIFHWDNLLNKNIKPIYAQSRPGDIKHSFADIDLIKEKMNFHPVISFIDGLKKLVKY